MNMTQSSNARRSWNISHRVVTTLFNQKVTVRKKTLTMQVGRAQEKYTACVPVCGNKCSQTKAASINRVP